MWRLFEARSRISELVNNEVKKTKRWNFLEGKKNSCGSQNRRMAN